MNTTTTTYVLAILFAIAVGIWGCVALALLGGYVAERREVGRERAGGR